MRHYVYMLTSNRDGRKYIGVRSCECEIHVDPYMSSSTEPREYVEDCIKVILKEFPTRDEAAEFEIALHELHDVGVNPLFFNKAKHTSALFDTTGNRDVAIKIALAQIGSKNSMYGRSGVLSPNFGRKLSDVTKDKIRQKRIGTKASDITREKMSKTKSGLNNSNSKLADVFCIYTDTIIAKDVCLSVWGKENNFGVGLIATANGKRKSHKGMYAKYKLKEQK